MINDHRKRVLDLLASGKITVDEADLLLERLEQKNVQAKAEAKDGVPPKEEPAGPKYVRVVVSDKDGEKANVRVPIGLVRAGIKLQALVPEPARAKLKEKGVDLDAIGSMKPEEVVAAFSNLTVDSESKGGSVKIFCE